MAPETVAAAQGGGSCYTRLTARPVGSARSDYARLFRCLGTPHPFTQSLPGGYFEWFVTCRVKGVIVFVSSQQKANGKRWDSTEMETIISDLHNKFATKSWNETFQLVRRCMDKSRNEFKPCEPLRRSMQRLQEVFKVSSINAMKIRLESIAKQHGLGFHVTDDTCYLTADLFYLEVVLLTCGGVEVVKVAPHGGAPVPSKSFLELLKSKDFAKFSKRLGDLFSQYNIPGDTELKTTLFEYLQALGKDLLKMSHLPRTSDDAASKTDQINNGIVGIVTFGREDCPLTVQFYESPHTGLTPVSETMVYSAQLSIGLSDVQHRLQGPSSISQPPQLDAHGDPIFKSLKEVSCDQVPACFLLKLQPAVAMVASLWKKLSHITGVSVPDVDLQWAPLPSLLTAVSHEDTIAGQDIISTVCVAEGGMHTYVFPGKAWEGPAHTGTLVDSVPFTHLSHVPALLKLLRHQCTIHSILMSALTSKRASPCLPRKLHFEVLPETDTSFTVTFHRPDTDSLSVLVVDVPGSHQVTCRLFGAGLDDPSLEECISAVMKRCWSLPTTLQALYSKLSERVPQCSPTTAEAGNNHASPSDVSMMDTDGTATTFSQSAAVPEGRVALSGYAAVSVSQSELLPEINASPSVDPYPLPPVGVFSPWMTNNGQLSELI